MFIFKFHSRFKQNYAIIIIFISTIYILYRLFFNFQAPKKKAGILCTPLPELIKMVIVP